MTGYNGSTQTDGYDGDGLRAWKQAASDGDGSLRTYFLYDGSQPVVEEDGTGAFYSSNTFGADGLVSRFPGESLDIVRLDGSGGSDSSVFYTFDERGNVSERVNMTSVSGGPVRPGGPGVNSTSGSLSAVSEVYDAFGSHTAQSPQPEPWGYEAQAGYYTDSETGLILCTHRYYDPSTGRWLTRDPMGYGGGVNLYGYVGNDPTNNSDPSGYDPSLNGQDPTSPFPVNGTGTLGGGTTVTLKGGGGGATTISGTNKGGTGSGTINYSPPTGLQPPGSPSTGGGTLGGTATLNFGGGYNGTAGGTTQLGGPTNTVSYGGGYSPGGGFGGGFSSGTTFGGKKGPSHNFSCSITDKPSKNITLSGTGTFNNGVLTGGTVTGTLHF